MTAITLCDNCLEPGAKTVAVGREMGTQRDPWRKNVFLCETCENALLDRHFSVLAFRYKHDVKYVREEE